MSFSGLAVLMSTPSPEKDSLLGPTVQEKIGDKILKMEVFFGSPFIFTFCVLIIIKKRAVQPCSVRQGQFGNVNTFIPSSVIVRRLHVLF